MCNESKKQKYDKWVSKVCSFLVEESSKLNVTCGTFQSKPILDKQPDVVFLGYNPHETGPVLTLEKIRERFYKGNESFYSDDRKNKNIWRVWRYEDSFKWANYSTPIEDGHFIFFNAVYFGTNSIDEFESIKGYKEAIDKCHEYTEEVIHSIFRPKCVVCFSVEDCFDRLNMKFHFQQVKLVNTAEETDENILNEAQTICKPKWNYIYKCPWPIKKALWNNIPVYGIPHPSWPSLSLDDMGAIALYLKSEMQKLII